MHSTGTWKVTGIIINWICMLYAQVMVEVEDALLQCTRFDSYETTTTTTMDLPTREFVPKVDRIINTRGLNR